MKVKFTYPKRKFSKGGLSRSARKEFEGTFRAAVREFYRACWAAIPVHSGMARGSMLPLGQRLGNVPTTINPVVDWVSGGRDLTHYPQGKSVSAGQNIGDFKLEFTDKTARFEFDIRVFHWQINELGGHGPWYAVPRGMDAMREYLENSRLSKKFEELFHRSLEVR